MSFARGLKALVRFGTERYAVIDVGTNSVKFHVGERGADGVWRRIVDRAEITRLGEGLQETGRLNAEPIERTVEAIAGMVDEARQSGVGRSRRSERPVCASLPTAPTSSTPSGHGAVSPSRSSPGRRRAGSPTSRPGLGLGQAHGSSVVFDTGGGSSQFTFGEGDRVDERFSVDVGAVRLHRTVRPRRGRLRGRAGRALAAIGRGPGSSRRPRHARRALAMGGAVANLAAVKHGLAEYDPDVVQGTVLDRTEIDRQIELYRTRSVDERRSIVGLQPQRADIILAGACIVRMVLGQARKGLTHGQRSRSATRRPGG